MAAVIVTAAIVKLVPDILDTLFEPVARIGVVVSVPLKTLTTPLKILFRVELIVFAPLSPAPTEIFHANTYTP